MYGLGERFNSNFKLKDGKWTIFNRDHPFLVDHGDGHQTYGHYPYYLKKGKKNYFHLSYFRNSNAMDIIKETVGSKISLTYKAIGGVIDFRFTLGN